MFYAICGESEGERRTMSLKLYREKRHFSRTAEPKGGSRVEKANRFVVQKHAARHLHYDFRLELDGTLKSWAVPKGPSLDPTVKRLAVEVEDHPLEYADFEGTIPQGEYGGGTVMVWDRGTWTPEVDPEAGYSGGDLKFSLDGQKLHGSWLLVRTKSQGSSKPQWLLIKHRDAAAVAESEGDVLVELPDSAKTGRTLDEIASGNSPQWKSRPSKTRRTAAAATNKVASAPASENGRAASKARVRPRGAAVAEQLSKFPGAKRRAMPREVQAELATLISAPPSGNKWLHEIKFDGYRMLCTVNKGTARFVSRNGQDWTNRFAALAKAAADLPIERAILDGEVVVLDEKGVSQFQLLQNAMGKQTHGKQAPLYYIFDLLYLDGYDLTAVPLEERKMLLETLLSGPRSNKLVHLSEHVVGNGAAFLKQACHAQLEGIISKRRDSVYHAGRGGDWLKCKCRQTAEFVIGGFTRPEGSRVGFGALLLGYFRPDGKFAYVGRVGTGFDTRLLNELARRLKAIEQPGCPFVETPPGVRANGVRWVRPELVAQVEFGNWTDARILRQAAFQGLREDKPARDVGIELPTKVKQVKSQKARHAATKSKS
jgi:bifunctional non-homologous end joining protein LigD